MLWLRDPVECHPCQESPTLSKYETTYLPRTFCIFQIYSDFTWVYQWNLLFNSSGSCWNQPLLVTFTLRWHSNHSSTSNSQLPLTQTTMKTIKPLWRIKSNFKALNFVSIINIRVPFEPKILITTYERVYIRKESHKYSRPCKPTKHRTHIY